jgi:cytidine deaminase
MKQVIIETKFSEYENINELDNDLKLLSEKSIEVLDSAYAPYSEFNVGAAVLLENGEIITGTNQENAAYPSGLCAERVAIFYANSKYPNVAIKALAVVAKKDGELIANAVPPCGACRQVMLETENRFNTNMKLIMISKNSVLTVDNAKSLLPLSFDADYIK